MAVQSSRVVICGAGIAGVAAAYHLAVEHGHPNVTIVEMGHPLSLTSDKSTEAYRNWWPGPDQAMTAYMNRSIDLMEGIARATGNRINLNRRGYLFATADAGKVAWLRDMASQAEAHGAGPVRVHETASWRSCTPAAPDG
jgi:glycine/D-amino acid oxidase-like deaminating enzyme